MTPVLAVIPGAADLLDVTVSGEALTVRCLECSARIEAGIHAGGTIHLHHEAGCSVGRLLEDCREFIDGERVPTRAKRRQLARRFEAACRKVELLRAQTTGGVQ